MAEYNFSARTKSAFNKTFVYKDTAGVGVNLTGYTLLMDIKKSDGTAVADFTIGTGITLANQTTNPGQFTILAPASSGTNNTAAWPVETLYYDLLIGTTAQTAQAVLWGSVFVSAGVTT